MWRPCRVWRSAVAAEAALSAPLPPPPRTSLVPSCWGAPLAGWFLEPSSTCPASSELPVAKTFSFLQHGVQYAFLGEVMALAEELPDCAPRLDWFYTELHFTLPPNASAEVLASFMNDLERERAGQRNTSFATGSAGVCWSAALRRRVETRAQEDFCWLHTEQPQQLRRFLDTTFVQWYHRADYLVTRMSRDKRDYRPDVSMQQVMQDGRERRRRMQRRKMRDETRASELKSGLRTEYETMTHDVLPRELREALDKESDGMEDVHFARPGSSLNGWAPSWRRTSPLTS